MASGDIVNVSVVVLSNDIQRVNARAKARAKRAVRRCGYAIRRFSVQYTPIDTGDLRNRVEMEIFDGGTSAELRWLMPYGIYQHEGTSRGVPATRFAAKGAERAAPTFQSDMANIFGEGV